MINLCIHCKILKSNNKRLEKTRRLESELRQLQAELDKLRWIPVSEGLPEAGKHTQSDWVHITDGKNVIPAYYYDYTKITNPVPNQATGKGWYRHGMSISSITHWKPIILPKD